MPEKDEEKHFEVEKILDHKTVGNKVKYLVKWKDFDNDYNSWEGEDNFDSKRIINKYLKSLKVNKVTENIAVRRSSRLRLNNHLLIFLLLNLFFGLLNCAKINFNIPSNVSKVLYSNNPTQEFADIVPGNFKYCNFNLAPRPLMIDSVCQMPKKVKDDKKSRTSQNFKRITIMDSKKNGIIEEHANGVSKSYVSIDVYTKEENEVDGTAYECIYLKKKYKFLEDFSFGEYEQDWEEYVELTDYKCHNMVKHKRCGYSGATMTCNNAGTCKYDGVAEAEYNWLHSILKETDHCTVKVRKIRAKTSKSMFFGANCKAEDLHCTLGHSMFV